MRWGWGWRWYGLRWGAEAALSRRLLRGGRWSRRLLGSGSGLLLGWGVLIRRLGGWGWLAAGNAVGQLATERGGVEGQSSRTTLQPGVSAHAKPVAHAAFLDGNVAVWTVLADRVLLAVGHVVWPIAGVHDVVVEEGEGALLDSGRPVPALPVAGATRLVSEDSVLPVAVLAAFGRLSHDATVLVRAPDSVWVVAVVQKAPVLAREGEAVGAEVRRGHAILALVVVVAVLFVLEETIVLSAHVVLAALAEDGAGKCCRE